MRVALILAAAAAVAPLATAHEVRPAYLQLRETAAYTYDVLFKVPALGEDLRFALNLELPSGCVARTEPRRELAGGAFIERWTMKCAGGLTGGSVSIAGLKATLTDALVRLERLDGTSQVVRLTPAAPSFVVAAAPGRLEVAGTYLRLGVEHILGGVDHLLYILALLFLVKGARRIVLTMTAFTATHSLTLTGAALGFVHVPQPPVEVCIALSIVFVASEIVRSREGRPGLTERWPWLVSFTFGLLHGFGFAGALSEVGLPEHAIPVALLFFNVGVEVGQLLFIASVFAIAALALRAQRRLALPTPAWAWRVPAYAIGGVATCWTLERLAAF